MEDICKDSKYYDEEECHDENLIAILQEYRRQRLIESLTGPVISSLLHLGLIIILAILFTDQFKEEVSEIVVVMKVEEEVKIEEPPPVEEPELQEVEDTEVTNPVLTTVTIENVETNDAALEDVNDEAPSTEDDSTVETVSDVVVSPSVFASPSVFGSRSTAGRASAVAKFGGSKEGQASLVKALMWLAEVQNPDGSWGQADQPAHTGLALLTFLAHGETHLSKKFGGNVKKALQWLVSDPVGQRHPGHGRGYEHAIKTYALSEAYAMTGLSQLEYAMNENIRRIIDGQQQGGSFEYGYNTSDKRQDLSLAGWNYQAMKAAHNAGCEEAGLQDAIYKAIDWLKKNTTGQYNFPYETKENMLSTKPSRPTMRAVGVLCLQLFGEGDFDELKDDLSLISTVDYENLTWTPKTSKFQALYGWYYATQAMFQEGGKSWKKWNRKFQKVLTENQHEEGYWTHDSVKVKVDGGDLTLKIYCTCLSALQLTVYYRYLPSSKGAKGGKEVAETNITEKIEQEGLDLID